MSTKKQLRMTLELSTGKELTLSLADPKDGLTIVAGEAYPVSIKDIAVQTVDTEKLA